MLISLTEYARKHGKDESCLRRKAAAGGFQTARKIGRNWVIEDSEPCTDRRVKTGRYRGWRKTDDSEVCT